MNYYNNVGNSYANVFKTLHDLHNAFTRHTSWTYAHIK